MEQAKAVGAEKNHLSARLSDGVDSVAAIMFRAPNIAEMLQMCARCGVPSADRYVEELQKRQSDGGPYRTARCFGLPMLQSGDHLLSSRAEAIHIVIRVPLLLFGAQEEPSNAFVESNREQWEMLAKKEPQALRSKLASALIGTATLHEAQAKTLELLDAGSRCSRSWERGGANRSSSTSSRSNWRSSSTSRASSSIRCARSFPIRRSICVRWFHASA